MLFQNILLLLVSVLLCSSCRSFKEETLLEKELAKENGPVQEQLEKSGRERKLRSEIHARFRKIRKLIYDRKLLEAENQLATMRQLKEYSQEIAQLDDLIALSKTLTTDATDLAIDHQIALKEANEGLKLPDSYKTVRVIGDKSGGYDLPKSPLESMLDRKISLKIAGVSLHEFAMQLGKLDGLNIADPLNVIFSDEAVKNKTFSANFKNVPLREIFAYISGNLGVDFTIVDNMIWVTAAPKNRNTGLQLETKVIRLRQGLIPKLPEGIGVAGKAAFSNAMEEDTDLETALKVFYAGNTTGGSYTLFKTRNMLLVNDTRANIRRVQELVKELDRPPYQVVIEAKFLTVSQRDLLDVGVEISHKEGGKTSEKLDESESDSGNLSDFFTQLGALKAGSPEGVGALTISGVIGNRSFDVLMSAIASKQSTVTMSAPRITTLNNRAARIRKGDMKYYFEEYAIQSIDLGDKGRNEVLVPIGKPAALPLGITFDVRANVGNDGHTVILGMKPEIVNFLEWEDFSSSETHKVSDKVSETNLTEIKLPRTHEQTIAASVKIDSGQTVVLGGMIENVKRRLQKKVPVLGDIPYLGFFFKRVEYYTEPMNLLIFVTATVIDENGQYVIVDKNR